LSYQYEGAWVHVNLSGYYSKTKNGTEWTPLYYDDANSFSYMSLTGIDREYYGAELGVKFKVTSAFEINVLGTVGESKYTKDADVRYLMSTKGTYDTDLAHIKGMRESGTPLTATSIGLSYHAKGWYLDLYGNYYDRIYLSYSPTYRFESNAAKNDFITNTGEFDYDKASQAKGNGGFMLDASIGRSMYVKKGSLSVNLMLTNILNKRDFCTGGYEQNRSDRSNSGKERTYVFSMNPKKYYAYGINGMLIVSYRF
ncbi:MAG: TonB-dependent receptor, partial [Prevotella sp.]|nr:TonB-dependent receptor [Prevotella sp.]